MLVLTILTFLVWKSIVVLGDGSVLRPENSLDYVSLTDHGRSKYSDLSSEGNTTWILGRSCSSSNLQSGCKCDSEGSPKSKVSYLVKCICSDNEQVVNLKGTGRKEHLGGNETWSWKISGCSNVIIHQNILSAFFDSGNKLRLRLEFHNISQVTIHESAFTLKDSGSFSHETTVLFNNCDINNVPPKAFPSYLSLIKFTTCKIDTLSSRFIQSVQMDKIIFDNSSVGDIQSDAFYSSTMIGSLLSKSSHFKQIRPEAVASGIQLLNWTDCVIDRIERKGLSGLIVNFVLARSTIINLETLGFSIKTWSMITFINNTFENVSHRGIVLADRESTSDHPAYLTGNLWNELDRDFITTGMSEEPLARVENNTFLKICSCGVTFTSLLTLNGSKAWFHDELFQSSRCSLNDKENQCLQSENSTDDGFVTYTELPLLCSTEMFMCMSEVKDMQVNPKLPNRLEILAFLIGAFVLFMVVSLLLTLLVYLVRRQSPRKQDGGNANEVTNDVPRKEFVKSLNHDPYVAINQKMTKTPSMPSRMGLFEDVEMEDKGVQTLPTELSADIIEGLREKLSKPDSFWDAKETIDHLYDLIHVQSVSAPSPPDVTFRNDTNEMGTSALSTAHNTSSDSLKLLVSPSRRLPKVLPGDKSPRRSMSTFAQIPSPSKSAPVCEYRDPSDSRSHIYSELSGFNGKRKVLNDTAPVVQQHPSRSPPIVCDYTEPHDFQAHIYAELFCTSQNPATSTSSPSKASCTQTDQDIQVNFDTSPSGPPPPLPTSVIPSSNHNLSTNLNDLNLEPSSKALAYEVSKVTSMSAPSSSGSNSSTALSNIPGANIANGNPTSQIKRPLPSIPVPSLSTVQ